MQETEVCEIRGIEIDEEPELLLAMERAYEIEQKKKQSEGALKALITLFENPKAAKGNKAWADFFLSELFLKEYFEEDFANALDYYLEHQIIYAREELPQGFLVEWAISYAMFAEEDGCMYQTGDFLMHKVIAKYWNQQTEMWRVQRGSRIILRVENKVRMQAFSDYGILRILEKQGKLTEENEYEWCELIWHGKPHFLYEVCKRTENNATSVILLKLLAYWVAKDDMSLFLAEKIYKEYDLKGNEISSHYSVYKEIKEAILHRFPEIEKDDVQEAIKVWVSKVIELSVSLASREAFTFEQESESTCVEIEKLFLEDVWKKYWNHTFMMQWLTWKLDFKNMPRMIAQNIYSTYSMTGGIETYERQQLRERSLQVILNHQMQKDKNRLLFWEYFFQRGFGVCSIEATAIPKEQMNGEVQRWIRDGKLHLPAYMKYVFQMNEESQKEFLGYKEDIGSVETPKFYEFILPDGDVIRAEYYLHYISYYRNGKRIYKPYITYETLERYEKGLAVAEEFFILLALTDVTDDNRNAAQRLALKWLSKTIELESVFSIISNCIVQNNALERSAETSLIMEKGNQCLMIQSTEQGFKLYEYTEFGWIHRSLRAGVDWNKMDMDAVLQAHMKPVPKKIESFEMKGLSADEKAKVVWDGLLLYAKHKSGGSLYSPILPKDYPMLHPLFDEGGMGWLTDSFVVLYYELSPNTLLREVLYISVGDWGCGGAYSGGSMSWKKEEIQALQRRIKRSKPEQFVLMGNIIREDYPEQQARQITPILFGENGKVYGSYGLGKLCETESAFELISKIVELKQLVRCEVYEGKMTISAQGGQLEYCFTKEEYEEAYANYKRKEHGAEWEEWCETLVEYYCVMGKE